jgi:NAD(P)H-dependent FMN reductase
LFYIPIILGSTRRGRQSGKVANFVKERMKKDERIEAEVLDLLDYNFPMMEERLRLRDDAPPQVSDFSSKIDRAAAVVIVSPEYNNGYPGVLKNALDYLGPKEYERKPFGIVTVSGGNFGGLHALEMLRLVTLGMGGFPIPASLPFSRVQDVFADDGSLKEAAYERRTDAFIAEVLWFAEAITAQKAKASVN